MARVTFAFIGLLLFTACIGEDILDDQVAERLVFINPIDTLQPESTHQLSVRFFNNVGAEEFIAVEYNSTDETVATVGDSGLIQTLTEGQTTIEVNALSPEGTELSDAFDLEVTNAVSGPHGDGRIWTN